MILTQIACDRCGKVGTESLGIGPKGTNTMKPRFMREMLKTEGWAVNVFLEGRSGKDYCAKCAKLKGVK